MRRAAILILSLITLVAAPAAAARPVLLLFHAGAFCFGSPGLIEDAARYAKPRFQPDNVDYKLCRPDLGADLRSAVAEAKRFPSRHLYAYGESAGGSIAARLAEKGLVRAAAVQVPVADVPTFFAPFAEAVNENTDGGWPGYDTWRADARRLSPDRHQSRRPIRVFEARRDSRRLRAAAWTWIHDDPKVTGTSIPGKHLEEPFRTDAQHAAIDWLAAKF